MRVEFVTYVKNAAVVLATASTVAYVSGYLALRARSFALGTDPGFTLVDEGYVFAGFRFVFVTLIIILVLSPIIILIRSATSWLYENIPNQLLNTIQWILLVILALGTLMLLFNVLSVNGILLHHEVTRSNSMLRQAALGGVGAVILMFIIVLLAVLSVLWLKMRLSIAGDLFSGILGIVVAIQLFLLPIIHGVLYADRQVRVLAAIPNAVQHVKGPLGVVDRTSEHVTLLGLDGGGQPNLVSIKLDDMNGVPIKDIVSLREFVQVELKPGKDKRDPPMPNNPDADRTTSSESETAKDNASFFNQLVKYFQVTFEEIGSLGYSEVDYGQIWSVQLEASGLPSKPHKISEVNNLAWPILDIKDNSIYAIQGSKIVKLKENGHELQSINSEKHWVKLFGVSESGDVFGMVYEDAEKVPAILHPNGAITLVSALGAVERQRKAFLLEEARSYLGNRSLYVERSARGGRGYDVFYKKDTQIIDISDCGDDKCGQPSFSPDFGRILYIRKARY